MVKVTFFFKEKDGSIKKETKKFGLRMIPTLNKWIKQGRILVDIECKDKHIESYMKNEIIKQRESPETYEPQDPIPTAVAVTGAEITKVRVKIKKQTDKYLEKLRTKTTKRARAQENSDTKGESHHG